MQQHPLSTSEKEDRSPAPTLVERDMEAAQNISEKPDPDFLVTFDGPDDPTDPLNYPRPVRWAITFGSASMTMSTSIASTCVTGISSDMQAEFGFSSLVSALTVSLFILGYAVGPIVWGPLSERQGRRNVFIWSFIPFTALSIGTAFINNTASLLALRLLAGSFAASAQSVGNALAGDPHRPKTRGMALSMWAISGFAGPSLGPIISGYVHVSGIGWRWSLRIVAIFVALNTLGLLVLLPETYSPYILKRKAQRRRKETGDERWYAMAELEERGRSKGQLAYDIVASPFILLFEEPMLQAITLYISFTFGMIYLLFGALPHVFVGVHGLNLGQEGLTFLATLVGGVFCTTWTLLDVNRKYLKAFKAAAPDKPAPEIRLTPLMVTAPLFAITFFWLGWTGYTPSISYWSAVVSLAAFGFCVQGIFNPLINYVVDVWTLRAATAISITTICRALFGAATPLFSDIMYRKMGIQWASTLLGCIALLFVPIPFVFKKYGPKLRAMSKNARNQS